MFAERSGIQKLLFLKAALAGGGSAIERTAIGNPLTFQTDLARPLKSLLIPFTPVQSGTGDPSPQNIRSILPWDGLKVYHSGSDTSEYTETDISFPSPVYGGEHEAVSGKLMDGWKVETLNDSDAWTDSGTFISYSNHTFTDRKVGDSFIGVCSALPIKNNVPSGTAYMRWGGTDAPNILIAPNGSGLTLEDVKTLSGQGKIVLAYPLATPQEITLTPEQITALKGDNTIWSDADGSMTAVYLVSEAYAEDHPISGGLGSGLLGGGLGSGPEDPGEDPVEDPGQEEGPDPEEGEGE